VDVCTRCGAGLTPGAPWCSLCLTPRGTPALSTGPVVAPLQPRSTLEAAPAALTQRTRYGTSEMTFGLTGRIIMTILLILPLALFIPAIALGFGIVGMGIWGFVVIPWGLRDIWRSSHRRGLTSLIPPAADAENRFGADDPRQD
jgi:hypothetical protein